ncbi:MAG: YafY family protein [Pseudomonadota bacterium]
MRNLRGTQSSRQWRIVRLLESRTRGMTARQIASELEEDIRTVYRDLDALEDGGFPLYKEREGRNSYWKMLDGSKPRVGIPFTASELMSLHMSGEILQAFQGTVFHDGIQDVLKKVRSSLSPKMLGYLEQYSGHLTAGFSPRKDYEAFKETIGLASRAVADGKRVEIRYKAASTGRTTTRRIDPLQVWAFNGVVYLIGFCHVRGAVRTFAADRIKDLRVLDETFEYPDDFNLQDYLRSAFRVMTGDPVRIRVRFAREAAHVVRERIWHPTQEIREQRNGDIVLTLEVPINYEITSWILGFGAAAEVLSPPELRTRLRDDHLAAARAYRGKAPVPEKSVFDEEILPRVT